MASSPSVPSVARVSSEELLDDVRDRNEGETAILARLHVELRLDGLLAHGQLVLGWGEAGHHDDLVLAVGVVEQDLGGVVVEALVELLGGGLSQPKDLLKGEVHLVVEEDAEGLAKVLLLEPLDEGLHVLEVLLKEGLLLEDGRHQIELVERRTAMSLGRKSWLEMNSER